MDLNEIRVFVKVVQAGSFSLAAKQLGMPNSTVSARVSALERRLGVTLLQRTTRKLHLAEAGELYFRKVAQGMEDILRAEAEVGSSQREPQGLLRVTAPIDMGDTHFVELVCTFKRKYPKVSLELIFSDRRLDLIAEGVDVAIRAGELKDSGLIAKKLGRVCWAAYASPAYLKRAGSKHSVSVPLASRVIGNDMTLMKALALSDMGIALLPTYACRAEVKSGKLIRVLPGYHAKIAPVHLVYPGQMFVPPKLRAFIEIADAIFKRALQDE